MKSQSQNLREIVKDRSDIYETIFDSINNNTIIGKMNKDGVYIPISCTSKYLEMMECTFEEYSKAESETPFSTVHPDDKDKLIYLFRNGETETGESF